MEPFENPFACAFCEQSFSKASFLVNHVQIEHNSNKLLNANNEKEDINTKAQETSILSKYTIDKLYRCKYCEKILRSKIFLAKHEKFHSGEKVYFCGYCEKKFPGKRNLKVHEMIHTAEKS